MKFIILAIIAVIALGAQAERDLNAVYTTPGYETVVGGVAAPVVREGLALNAGRVYGGYPYTGLTDFNRDGIPDQFERFGGAYGYPYERFGAYAGLYGGLYEPYYNGYYGFY